MTTQDGADLRRLLEMARRDGYFLTRRYPPADAGAGATSYFGATPRLPAELDWPVATGGRPINFLAQLDLATLPPMESETPLPREGTLFFFADTCGDREDGPPGPIWAAVRYAPGSTAALPMRPAPARLPPLFPGYRLFPWIAEMDTRMSYEPSTYPFWPIDPRPVRTYDDRMPHALARDRYRAYEQARAAADEEALTAAIGAPVQFLEPSSWSEPMRARFDFAPLRPRESRILWLPDDAWPYAWVNIRIFVVKMLEQLAGVERSFDSMLKYGNATPAAVAAARTLYASAAAGANRWYVRARANYLFAPVPSADRAAFVTWLRSIEQPYQPEWSMRDPNSRRFRLLVDGNFHLLDAFHLSDWTAKALLEGAHACLGYAAPGTPPSALPPYLVRLLRPAYAPSHVWHDGTRRVPARHQLLGMPTTVQTAVDEMSGTHRLLAQFEDDSIQFFFPGEGTVQFWITLEDLAARRFDQSTATIEST